VALSRHTSGGDKAERFVQGCLLHASVEDDLGDLEDVGRQSVVADWVLGDELKQRWVAEVVPAFEGDMLACEFRMLFQIGAQTRHVAPVEQIDGVAKNGVFNALMVG